MTYDVTETYAYTGDQIFDSAGDFNRWWTEICFDPFIVAVQNYTGDNSIIGMFEDKNSYLDTLLWDVDEQTLVKTTQWPDEDAYTALENYLDLDYTDSAFEGVTIGGSAGMDRWTSSPALDVVKTRSLP